MSIYDCPIKGTATIRRITVEGEPDRHEWIDSDPEIHIDANLQLDAYAVSIIEQRYTIGETCPFASETVHARLTTPAQPPDVVRVARDEETTGQ